MKNIVIIILFFIPITMFGQAWSGIIVSTRAIDWTGVGLPSTYPNGETTVNSWTPPSGRTQCITAACNTVIANAGASTPAQINAAIASASTKSFVLLPAGTYTINADVTFVGNNYITLHGSGAQSTIFNMSGSSRIQFGQSTLNGSATLNSTSYAKGTTTFTATGATCGGSCSGLAVNNVLAIRQCDTGWTGTGALAGDPFSPSCTSGAYSDPLGIFVCGIDWGVCANNNINVDNNHYYQRQMVKITNVVNNGGGSYTITFTPGLYMPNWSSNNNAEIFWGTPSGNWTYGSGIEDVTLNFTSNSPKVDVEEAYGWWVKGTRIIGGPADQISIATSIRGLFFNNYVYGLQPTSFAGANTEPLLRSQDSDNLFLNNLFDSGQCFWANGQSTGDVIAYNYCRDGATLYYQNVELDHNPYESFRLNEGNQMGYSQDDDTHGTHDLNTWFRNYYSGWDNPFVTLNSQAFSLGNYHRFDNFIGNIVGGTQSIAYSGTSFGNEFLILNTDALAGISFMRWGNCDVINAGCRFVSSEVPTSTVMTTATYPNSSSFQNPIPVNNNLPCSLFMTGTFITSPCSMLSNGGTGLTWWGVCKNWTVFPSSCAIKQVQPFPPNGPDQSGGPYVVGHGYDIPAAVAYTYLPIDTSLQNSLSIAGQADCTETGGAASSWSAGIETLCVDFSSIDNGSNNHIIGGFQFSGVNAACVPAGINFATLYGNNEILMTGSTRKTTRTIVTYVLAINPSVSCAGTFKFPNIRQFDENVFQNDPLGSNSVFSGVINNGMVINNGVVIH